MSFRKEKKIRLTVLEFNQLKDLLIDKGMRRLYEKRKISSLYYDTAFLDMFHHSEEGVLPRKKVRVRWYNSVNKFMVETKTSSVEGRYKTTHSLIQDSLSDLPKSISDQLYGFLTPSLLVSYERSYFSIGGVRVTFDSLIKYQNFRYSSKVTFEDPERVVEVKVDINTSDDFIESLIPYATSRFSKYSRGLLISQSQS